MNNTGQDFEWLPEMKLDDVSIRNAVNDWLEDEDTAVRKWGPIEHWDTSQVTNMSGLFSELDDFSADLSGWDTGNVTDMSYMFYGTMLRHDPSFVSRWDMEKVTNRKNMMDNPPLDMESMLMKYTIKLNRYTNDFMYGKITHEQYNEKFDYYIDIINKCRKKMGKPRFRNALEFATGHVVR